MNNQDFLLDLIHLLEFIIYVKGAQVTTSLSLVSVVELHFGGCFSGFSNDLPFYSSSVFIAMHDLDFCNRYYLQSKHRFKLEFNEPASTFFFFGGGVDLCKM